MAAPQTGPEHSAESAANRLVIRAKMRREKIAARMALPATTHALLSAKVEAHLGPLLDRVRPAIVGYCWPMRAEFDCRPLVVALLARGARACLPLVLAADAAMAFREWTPDSPMREDQYGILQPTTGELLVPDVLLMPINAIDERGYRLGYGGGYFDRTLAALDPPPLAIGVGFELARVGTTLPGPHDIAMDAVVTEAGIRRVSARLAL